MGWACLEYVFALSTFGILVSSLSLVFLFDPGPESPFSFHLPFNTVKFLEQ